MLHRVLIVLLLLACTASPAMADDRARAREVGGQGLKLYEEKQYAEAFDKLAEAEALHHAPTLVLFMARAKRNLGAFLEARIYYTQLVDEKLPPDANPKFHEAKEDAFRELKDLDAKIPRVLITIVGGDKAAVAVSIDGKAVDSIEQPVELDPGSHEIVANDGERGARKSVTLEEGAGIVRVDLTLEEGGAAIEPGDPEPGEPDEVEEGTDGLIVGSIVAFSLGAIGLGVGIGTGVAAMSKTDDIRSRCPTEDHCLTTDQEEADSAITLGTVSTIGFVIGGVFVAAGVVFLIIPLSSDEEAATLRVSPTGFAVEGAF